MSAFTVVVPTYDRPEQLASCLASLARLDDPTGGWELIVVDDGTPGGVEHVIDTWPRADVEIRLIVQANAGPAAARNRGAAAARSELLAFTDDDCLPERAWLTGLEACLGDESDDLVGGPTRPSTDGVWLAASESIVDFIKSRERSHGPHLLPSNNLACRSEVFDRMGGFDTTFPSAAGEDREFSRRWLRLAGDLRVCSDAVVAHGHTLGPISFWRQHEGYGRGAVRYRDRAADAEAPAGPMFVLAMIAHPLRATSLEAESMVRRLRLAACVAISQAAVATGTLIERVAAMRRRPRKPSPTGHHS